MAPFTISWLPLLLLLQRLAGLAQCWQPKSVVTVESHPARKVMGSISLPEGSPWCNGRPTYWLVGHQNAEEAPWCLDERPSDDDFSHSTWIQNSPAMLDTIDPLNAIDGPNAIDRHDCTTLDIDGNGSIDMVCGVGADKGKGHGYNEVYVTVDDESDGQPRGSVRKVLSEHGLHKFTTMRNRLAVTLHDPHGVPLVFLAVRGDKRDDGGRNTHRMFRLVRDDPSGLAPTRPSSTSPSSPPSSAPARESYIPTPSHQSSGVLANATSLVPTLNAESSRSLTELGFFFDEIRPNPWSKYTRAECALVVDLNGDGIDDLVMCNARKQAGLFLQNATGDWEAVPITGKRSQRWRNARVGDVTGDGVVDLVVVGFGGGSESNPTSYLRVFQGFPDSPFFDFRKKGVYFETELPYAAPDLELFDANNDGLADIYVVQTNEVNSTYCSGGFDARIWWSVGTQPPPEFEPPPDDANDLVLLGVDNLDVKFVAVSMSHSEPGCGSLVQKFGSNRTLLLAQGTPSRPGHNLLLQW